jgi:hypothetical protein
MQLIDDTKAPLYVYWIGTGHGDRAVVIESSLQEAIHRAHVTTGNENFDDLANVWCQTLAQVRGKRTRAVLCYQEGIPSEAVH